MTSRILVIITSACACALAQTPNATQARTAQHAPPQQTGPKVRQETFDSPEAATQALIEAAAADNTATLRQILGSSAKGILTSGSATQDKAERGEFARIANAKHQLVKSSMNPRVMVLLVGDQQWPFPIPLLHDGDKWRFDPQRGAIEVRARQIGTDELDAIQACAAFVGVQEKYAAKNRSAAGTLEYAQTVASAPVPKEFAAAAGPHPTHAYHGYYFRVLKQQGPNAPGGEHSYVFGKSNSMIGGFALAAWPAVYGVTGIHSFVVNQDGVVYEKDRGPKSSTPIVSYNPDASWMPVD